ncbi:MAG: hypothetical protein ABI002_11015 [Saprospiraceae bacterium]
MESKKTWMVEFLLKVGFLLKGWKKEWGFALLTVVGVCECAKFAKFARTQAASGRLAPEGDSFLAVSYAIRHFMKALRDDDLLICVFVDLKKSLRAVPGPRTQESLYSEPLTLNISVAQRPTPLLKSLRSDDLCIC